MGEYQEELEFLVVPMADWYELILGADWLAKNKVQLDYDPDAEQRVVFKKKKIAITAVRRVLAKKGVKSKVKPGVFRICAVGMSASPVNSGGKAEIAGPVCSEIEFCSNRTLKKIPQACHE